MKIPKRFGLIAVCLCLTMMLVGCGDVVPSGYTVMIVKPGGETELKSEGVAKPWFRDKIYYINSTLKSYPKQMDILCKDGLNMDVTFKLTATFDVSQETSLFLRTKIEPINATSDSVNGLELSFAKFFDDTLMDKLDTIARGIIAPYPTDAIGDNRLDIEKAVKEEFIRRVTGSEEEGGLNYPIVVSDLVLTNINPPKEILEKKKRIKEAEMQNEENAALAKAAVEQAKRDAELAGEKGKALLVEAQADAAANDVRAKSLTPEILAMKQLETLVKLAEGTNNMAIVIPYDAIKTGLDQKLLRNSYVKELSDKMGSK